MHRLSTLLIKTAVQIPDRGENIPWKNADKLNTTEKWRIYSGTSAGPHKMDSGAFHTAVAWGGGNQELRTIVCVKKASTLSG